MSENAEDRAQLDRKKLQEDFLESVESKLKRSEKDIWFIKNEDHPQRAGLSKEHISIAHK